jgi:hypothetical protein
MKAKNTYSTKISLTEAEYIFIFIHSDLFNLEK